MAQLIVRELEKTVVARLRRRAAEQGVSVEEAHRRLLREVLLRRPAGKCATFKDFLAAMPDVGDDTIFTRSAAENRPVRL
ncbi:MAG: hypothetical protein A3G75_16225 [Verrucomicrobia bacterium RIFCSPLOWO2_12_FULL_64_8]|nr:MAG: hypothetical protein A3G75_16225 [Verrucomicrobia bacterium RIFCSPLOWO2_12_FULL_64_8]